MSVLVIVLISVLGSLSHTFIAGLCGGIYARHRKQNRCNECTYKKSYCFDCGALGFFVGLLWPLSVILILGILTSARVGTSDDRKDRKELRKASEYRRKQDEADANHRHKMAELDAQNENLRLAQSLLINDGVKPEVFRFEVA